MNQEFSNVQAEFRKSRGTRRQVASSPWIIEKAWEFQKSIYFCFIGYFKVLDCVDHNKLWEILKEIALPDHLTFSWETCMQVKKQQLERDMEQLTFSKLGKEYNNAIFSHSFYVIYMQCTSHEMLGWMKHSWNQDCPEKYQQPPICRWYHLNGRKCRGTK